MDFLRIEIFKAGDDSGYYYDIFDTPPEDGLSSHDGGFCTTTMENALGMAMKQAEQIIKTKQ